MMHLQCNIILTQPEDYQLTIPIYRKIVDLNASIPGIPFLHQAYDQINLASMLIPVEPEEAKQLLEKPMQMYKIMYGAEFEGRRVSEKQMQQVEQIYEMLE